MFSSVKMAGITIKIQGRAEVGLQLFAWKITQEETVFRVLPTVSLRLPTLYVCLLGIRLEIVQKSVHMLKSPK